LPTDNTELEMAKALARRREPSDIMPIAPPTKVVLKRVTRLMVAVFLTPLFVLMLIFMSSITMGFVDGSNATDLYNYVGFGGLWLIVVAFGLWLWKLYRY
jgi:hypothetical protein